MNSDTQDLADIVRAGGKIIRRGQAAPPTEEKPSDTSRLLKELQALTSTLIALVKKPIAASPAVSVAAPSVSVKPEVVVRPWRKLRFDVTERDNTAEQRIKTIIVEALE